MSVFPIGIFVALTAMFLSVRHLGQTPANYFDYVAVMVVLGGTLSVAIVLLPWQFRRDIFEALKSLFVDPSQKSRNVLAECLTVVQSRPNHFDFPIKSIYQQILKDGLEMIQLNFDKEKVQLILHERLGSAIRRRKKVANAIKSLAKYPPAFGLMGTVIGLVNVMRGVSTGIDGKQTALEMAIALVATMYGLLTSNLLLNPAGEMFTKQILEDEAHGEIAITAIGLLMDEVSFLEVQEILNSYVPADHRVSLIDGLSEAA